MIIQNYNFYELWYPDLQKNLFIQNIYQQVVMYGTKMYVDRK